MPRTFLFYDLETTGRDPRWHRIVQFAAQRTNEALEPIEAPIVLAACPDPEIVPEPEALLVTGLGPSDWAAGLDERALFAQIDAEFSRPGTCVVGYNSLRFDDEFVRYGLWRTLRDPYAREWRGGNSRWDLIDLARMAAAFRPDGVQWPEVDGRRSFRLEALARANGIEQTRAHDAQFDVEATIGLARTLRAAQPKLFDYYLGLRDKRLVAERVLPRLAAPYLHVSSRNFASPENVAVVATVAEHPVNRNSVIVADLGVDPAQWLDLDAATLRARLFATREALAGTQRPPLTQLQLNKVPAVAPLAVLDDAARARLSIDADAAQRTLELLRARPELSARIAECYGAQERAAPADVDAALYDGFLSDADRRAFVDLRDADAARLRAPPPLSARARELVARYFERSHSDALTIEERAHWQARVRARLQGEGGSGDDGAAAPSLPQALERARVLLSEGRDARVLEDFLSWGAALAARFEIELS